MLGKLIEWSARNVFIVILATLGLVGGGIYAVKHTPLDALPDLSDVQVIIYTPYAGQAPKVVDEHRRADDVDVPVPVRRAERHEGSVEGRHDLPP